MDYLITMEDGSTAFLTHHGVKGMKWGNQNEETKRKYGLLGQASGGGASLEEDEEANDDKPKKLDAEKHGFENTSAGRKAAYEEAGFNRKWSREKGMEKAKENFQNRLKPGKDTSRNFSVRLSSAIENLKKDVDMASTLKTREQKRKSRDYKNESAVNRDEYKGDKEGYEKAQDRTDAFYGKKGKAAQANEAKRRRASREGQARKLAKSGFKKGDDGVWRKI